MHTHAHTTHSVVEFTENYRALRSGMLQRVCVQNTHSEAILNCGTDDIGCDKGKKKRRSWLGEKKTGTSSSSLSPNPPKYSLFSHKANTFLFLFF